MIAVTGCARSGTAYAAALLTHLGYEFGHEELKADGVASWPLAARTRRAPWGPSPSKTLKAATLVLHQVREPLSAIRSIHSISERSWTFIYETTPCRPDQPLLVRSAAYWLHWNRMAEKTASRTYRLEDMIDELPSICAAMGRPPARTDVAAVPPANVRAAVVAPLDWRDLRRESRALADEVMALARSYGYDVPGAGRVPRPPRALGARIRSAFLGRL